jgi:hypothetical protein
MALLAQIGLILLELLFLFLNWNHITPSRASKQYLQHSSRRNLWKLIFEHSLTFTLLGILTVRTQLEMAAVWTLTTECLDRIGQSIEDYILDCLQIVIPRNPANVKDITA